MSHHKTPQAARQTFLTVNEHCELMVFLQAQLPQKSRKTVKSLLAHNQITVDGKIITQYNQPLEAGQQVVVTWGKGPRKVTYRGLKILFEDPYLIVIDKQPGLLCVATDQGREQTAYRILSDHVKDAHPDNRIFVVHRLDRASSGLMIYAKDRKTQQALQQDWRQTLVERAYMVAVQGRVEKDEGTITSWLKENKAFVMYSSLTPGDGQEAVTRYRVVKRSPGYSLLEVHTDTGRKNQIRVHMKDLGHPVVGDKKYGATRNPMNRLGVHAHKLTIRHPVTGQELSLESHVPGIFFRLSQQED